MCQKGKPVGVCSAYVLIDTMNIGPTGKSSWFEIALAVFFVVLVFGVFIFAFAAPIVSYFVTHKERWHDYTKQQKAKVYRAVIGTAVTAIVLIWLTTSPFSSN